MYSCYSYLIDKLTEYELCTLLIVYALYTPTQVFLKTMG